MIWDLITIGGGAAGFFGAITHAQEGGGSTLILERSNEVLGKVKISGGGRCNVTHDCPDPKAFSAHYPRGEKALIGPLHGWGAEDTVRWFSERGVRLKTEEDGRIFPRTDRSQTVIDCLTREAKKAGVRVRTRAGVNAMNVIEMREGVKDGEHGPRFELILDDGERLQARRLLLATGGTRLAAGARLAASAGHRLERAVPSLFTFKINDRRIKGLPGVSVPEVACAIEGTRTRWKATGPLLITHWGVSGPGILRLSAWGARELAAIDYRFTLVVDWLPGMDVAARIRQCRQTWGGRQLKTQSPFEGLSKRLWERFLEAADLEAGQVWSRVSREEAKRLERQLTEAQFEVQGKSLNKDEFVTCGGVALPEIDLKTMESRLCPGLYFAGEVIDVDGLTGGFNFQNAWTTGYHAGVAAAMAGRRRKA